MLKSQCNKPGDGYVVGMPLYCDRPVPVYFIKIGNDEAERFCYNGRSDWRILPMKKAIPALVAIVLIIIIGGVAFGGQILEKYSYSDEEADLYEYFGLVTEDEIAIVLQNDLIADKALLKDGRSYFAFDTVQNYFNTRFYIDKEEKLLLYTTPTEVIRTELDGSSYLVQGEEHAEDYVIFLNAGSEEAPEYYIAADFVKKYTNFSYAVYENPNRMQVYTLWQEQKTADIKEDTAVRKLGGVKSPILTKVAATESVAVLDTMETWSKVKTEDGFIGYVENKFLVEERMVSPAPVTDYVIPEYTSLTKDKKISLGWHAVYSANGNETLNQVAEKAQGMTVIAPTWFSVKDEVGNLRSFADKSYVEKAHEKGLEVWGVVDDFNYEDTKGQDVNVPKLLSQTTTRTILIDNIMLEAAACGMDGINIDFERIDTAEAGVDYVQFLRELSIRCRQEGLVLSIDNYVPYDFNSRYNLAEQGAIADYVIIMAYDEHWAGCEEAGSVASISYVEYSIEKTKEYVPENKIVTALPFYTRLWKTEGAKVSSEAYPMTSVDTILANYGMTPAWDDETSQNYAEATVGDAYYQIWIEDLESINVKLSVMRNYNLGGVAAWRLDYEPAAVWELINNYTAQ